MNLYERIVEEVKILEKKLQKAQDLDKYQDVLRYSDQLKNKKAQLTYLAVKKYNNK